MQSKFMNPDQTTVLRMFKIVSENLKFKKIDFMLTPK